MIISDRLNISSWILRGFCGFTICEQLEAQEDAVLATTFFSVVVIFFLFILFFYFLFFAHTDEVQRPGRLTMAAALPVCSSGRSLQTWI